MELLRRTDRERDLAFVVKQPPDVEDRDADEVTPWRSKRRAWPSGEASKSTASLGSPRWR